MKNIEQCDVYKLFDSNYLPFIEKMPLPHQKKVHAQINIQFEGVFYA